MARQTTRREQVPHQRLPNAWSGREVLRAKGQFWTPEWVAQAMVAYVLRGPTTHIFDPAVGSGAFFKAAQLLGQQLGRPIDLRGVEIDPTAIAQAEHSGLHANDLGSVELRDFVLHPPERHFAAIVANPPYIRHHRLPAAMKARLQAYGKDLIGTALDGRAGLHVYFLLRALELLEDDGRLAFILPADTCEGKFAPALWRWITTRYQLEALVTFTPDATPFPAIDTNALIVMLRKSAPRPVFHWARCTHAGTNQLKRWIEAGFAGEPGTALIVRNRPLAEALSTGLSRPPAPAGDSDFTLGDFAAVMRGIATGNNAFFFLTRSRAIALGLPSDTLRIAVGRTRDIAEDEITTQVMAHLDEHGRPTRLLSLDGRAMDTFPSAVQEYLAQGIALGLPRRPLIAQRKPWYKMEVRPAPPFLFAYLGRRNARFVRNGAGVVPLTSFLCVYPHSRDLASLDRLWLILQHPDTIANLARVGKSYGAGAIKVEPRALEALPIPVSALHAADMDRPHILKQATLFA